MTGVITYDGAVGTSRLEKNSEDAEPRSLAVLDAIPLYDANEPNGESQGPDVESQLLPCVMGEIAASLRRFLRTCLEERILIFLVNAPEAAHDKSSGLC